MKSVLAFRGSWRSAVPLWRGIRYRRRTAFTARRFLRPGIYLPVSETVWARRGAQFPIHLLRTKIAGRSRAARISVPYRWFRAVAGTFTAPRSRCHGTAELVVAAFDGGFVVLDEVAQRVYRTYGTGPMTPEDEQRRRRFTDHVSAPHFRARDGGAVVEEELIDGSYLDDLELDERGALVSTLVEQFAALTSSSGNETPSVTHRDLEVLLHQIDVPSALAHAWERVPEHWLSPGAPWIPTPREANAKNIVVRPDGRPAPIDLGDLQGGPFFDYPVGILVAAGSEVVHRFLSGDADYSFGKLFAAAGQSWDGTREARTGLLLARIVFAAYRDSLAEGVADRSAFSSSLHRRWEEIRDAIDGICSIDAMAS